MVSVLDSGSSGPGSGPGREHCVVFLGKTLCSHNSLLSFNRHFMNQARRTRHFAEPVMQANCTMLHSAEECITDTSELI